jgi:hypothetical protein
MTHISKIECETDFFRLCDRLDVQPLTMMEGNTRFWIAAIRSEAMRLSNLGERECNGVMQPDGFMGWTEKDQAKADNMRAGAETRAKQAFEQLFDRATLDRIEIEFQGDPRGPSIIVNIKGGPSRAFVAW